MEASVIVQRYREVMDRIAAACRRANRDPAGVQLVCVTKTVEEPAIRAVVAAGGTLLGESRVQAGRRKREAMGDLAVTWHLIGHLQTNKARHAVQFFDCIHSVDSLRVAESVNQEAARAGRVVPVYIQVNVAGEESKFGAEWSGARALVAASREMRHLELAGLMTMAPYADDPESARPHFRALRQLRDALNAESPDRPALAGLSMGMTNDFEVAVEEGATIVRIGSALFAEA